MSLRVLTCLLVLGLAPSLQADDDAPPRDVVAPPPADEFIIIPLRVHLLQADEVSDLHSVLTDEDVHRVLDKVNRIWNLAGVHWGLESIVREAAEDLDAFRESREASPDGRAPLNVFRRIRPRKTREFEGLHVYYIHKFSVNGVYLGSDFAFVQDTAKLREVEGGIDEPIPRVTAHELGHALGLSHRQDRTNLLASGTTGTKLNTREVETAREKALKIKGSAKFADVQKAAQTEGPEVAKKLRAWLDQVPKQAAPVAPEVKDQ